MLAALEELAEEFLGGMFVPPTLDQDIQDMTVLLHGPPEIVALAIDGEKDLIQMPFVTRLRPPMAELIRILLPKLAAPFVDRLVGDDHPAGEEEFFHIAIAEAEPEIEPDRVADDLDREAVVLVAIEAWCVHAPSMAQQVSADKPLNKLTMPLKVCVDMRPQCPILHAEACTALSEESPSPLLQHDPCDA
jgi:hypothetical protein